MLARYRECQLVILFCIMSVPVMADDQFVDLFDGTSLTGWVQHGGTAKYRVADGAIIGQSVPNTSNSFLCTENDYGDFVLEYEFKCDAELNSGVQFRSTVYGQDTTVTVDGNDVKISAGQVHGYQCEIDPNQSQRMWSSGIYDEGRRGWLYPGLKGGDREAFSKQGQKLYKPGEWNSVRVVCRGDHIQTWLNGELRADFHDDCTAEGFVGLQVHGVGGRQDSLEVRWRNIRIKNLTD